MIDTKLNIFEREIGLLGRDVVDQFRFNHGRLDPFDIIEVIIAHALSSTNFPAVAGVLYELLNYCSERLAYSGSDPSVADLGN